jgi:hypothetical protein
MHARHAHFMLQMYTLLCSVQVAELYKLLFSRWHVHDGNVLERKMMSLCFIQHHLHDGVLHHGTCMDISYPSRQTGPRFLMRLLVGLGFVTMAFVTKGTAS